MSQPKRYSLQICHTEAGVFHLLSSDDPVPPKDGMEFVRHEDYAALQAENERLRKAGSDNTDWKLIGLCAEATAKINELKSENDRLRKAGDAMASKIRFESAMADDDWGVDTGTPETVKAWLAAKEVQS